MDTQLIKNRVVIGNPLHITAKCKEESIYDQLIPGPSIGLDYLIFMLVKEGATSITIDMIPNTEEKKEGT